MSPALRYHLQTLGALWVGATVLLFALRDAPFARHTPEEGEAVSVVVTDLAVQDLSGAGEEAARGDVLVSFRAADRDMAQQEHLGRMARDRHEEVEVGAILPARQIGRHLLLQEDTRWGMRGRRAYTAWSVAAILFFGEALRRICFGKFSIRTRLAARGSGAGAARGERPPDRTPSEAMTASRNDRPG